MKTYLSYSLDDGVRCRASSGGFCKEFIRFCLENDVVDKAIITVLGDGDGALIPSTIITNDLKIIMSTKSNSIYDETNPLSVLNKLGDERYIFVGLPCHIVPMKKFCLSKGIEVITICLFCNHTSRSFSKCILNKVGLVENQIKHFEYRGSGWPGFIKIVTIDNKEIKLNFHDCWAYYIANYLDPLFKCNDCTFKQGTLDADINVGDAWIPEIINKDKKGTNIVVSNNLKSDQLLLDCAKKGYIHIESR